MMNISILGATGSVGRQTFEVVQEMPNIQVNALAAGSDYKTLAKQAKVLRPSLVALYDKNSARLLQKQLRDMGLSDIKVEAGMDGLLQCATMPQDQIVVNAIVGSIGLKPTLAALSAKKDVAIANKETLVAAGPLVMKSARQNSVSIRPMDSEHSAIWQCLQGNENNAVKRMILTASGGAFRTCTKETIAKSAAADALRHPNWNMGPKITIDCATMMNKGLEYIEAHWLFNMPYQKIDILIHPQSIIHSMVEFEDGAVMAQLAAPDMGQPIQYALSAPARLVRKSPSYKPLDFLSFNSLTFEKPDLQRFPCLALAIEAAKAGGTMTAMMNAVNERLVAAFLQDAIGFYDISGLIEKAMGSYTVKPVKSLTDVEEAEVWADEFCKRALNNTDKY